LVKETECKVKQIQNNLRVAHSRQKSYADRRHQPLRFAKGDHVYLKVSSMKGVNHFGVKGKLAPHYIGPFPIIDRCGLVAYRLKLPERLSGVQNVFHVSQLKKCLRVPDQVHDFEDVELEPDLTYAEYPIRVLDQKDRITRRTTTNWYKVQWSQHSEEEATWESEDYLMENFPKFYASLQTSGYQKEVCFKWMQM